MRSIHIERIDLAVRGVDAATVQLALRELPGALGSALAASSDDGATGTTLGAAPSGGELAQAVARQVAAAVRRRTRTPGLSSDA